MSNNICSYIFLGIIVGLDEERRVVISELKPGSLAEKNGQMKAGKYLRAITYIYINHILSTC